LVIDGNKAESLKELTKEISKKLRDLRLSASLPKKQLPGLPPKPVYPSGSSTERG